MQDQFFPLSASQEVSADLGAIFIDNTSALDLGAYDLVKAFFLFVFMLVDLPSTKLLGFIDP